MSFLVSSIQIAFNPEIFRIDWLIEWSIEFFLMNLWELDCSDYCQDRIGQDVNLNDTDTGSRYKNMIQDTEYRI